MHSIHFSASSAHPTNDTMPARVAVVFGGTGAEAAVSCASAADVLSSACMAEALAVYIAKDGAWYITDTTPDAIGDGSFLSSRMTPAFPARLGTRRGFVTDSGFADVDVVMPVLHGDGGEDGLVQGTLATAGIPFVGASTRTGVLGCDKAVTKTLARAAGIPVTPFVVRRRGMCHADVERMIAEVFGPHPFPLFIKPTSLGSSVGARPVDNKNDLIRALDDSACYGDTLIEPYLSPLYEIECGFLGGAVPVYSDIAGIRCGGAFYDYDEKYIGKKADIRLPADLPADLTEALYTYARALTDLLQLRDLCRLDFFLTKDGTLYFNEVNTFPGFTKQSIYPRMMERMGIPYDTLLRRLCAMAYARGV